MEKNDWHLQEASAVLTELKTDMYTGLSTKEATIRRRRGGVNRVWYIHRTSVQETALACLSDLATLLLAVTAIFAAIFEESRSALAIVGILILGALIRTVTYCKAKRILEDNASIGIPTCSVLRDGKMHLLSAEELVVGDIVFLEGGDMVPADGRIVAGDEMAVSERGITANRDTVQKFETVIRTAEAGSAIPAEYRSNLLYAGSTVLWGQARMVITAIGEDTLIVRKQGGIRVTAGEKLPLLERLTGWCRISALVMLACVLVITALALFLGHGFTETFLSSMVLAVASMSEYLTAIAYIIIAIAVQDTGRQKRRQEPKGSVGSAVIGDSTALERIANVRHLVLSDIGLVKSGDMTLVSWFAGGGYHASDKAGADTLPTLARLLRYMLATVGGSSLHTALSGSAITAMPEKYTMLHKAADSYTRRAGKPIDYTFTTLDHVDGGTGIAGGLDTVLLTEPDGEIYAVVSGDIEKVMACCTLWDAGDGREKELPLDAESRKRIFTEAARLAISGAKVIACAKRKSPYTTLNRLSLLQSNMTFVGFCAMAEPAAVGVREALAALREAEISLILLSSEPERDLYYGREIGLFDKDTAVLTGAVGEKLPEKGSALVVVPPVQTAALTKNVDHSRIRYERVKALLAPYVPVDGANEKGKRKATRAAHTTMVVRSVLDARLLTLGDTGAAVASGEAAHRPLPQPLKAKADMTVYPAGESGGLAEVVTAMYQSRRALYHLWCAAVYLSVSQVSRMVLLLCSVLFRYPMPSAAMLLLIGLIIDFAAVLVMAFIRVPQKPLTIPERWLRLPAGRRAFASLAGLGLLWGTLEGCLPLLCTLLHLPTTGILVASILLTQLLFSGAVGQRESFFRCRFHVAYGLYALASLVLMVICLLWEPMAWYGYFLSLVPALVMLAVWEGWKAHAGRTHKKSAG